MSKVKVGEKAPYFEGVDQDGNNINLDTYKGKKLIMFFYPKDDTPGCTKAACSIRDNYNYFQKQGYAVLGVSPDNDKKHRKFIDKYEFQFPLLADPDKSTLETFGFWGEKKFMGKDVTGVLRTTIVLDENGVITHIIDKVKTAEHGQQLREELGI
jgi:peroxiredoxin Q/BCP